MEDSINVCTKEIVVIIKGGNVIKIDNAEELLSLIEKLKSAFMNLNCKENKNE